MTPRRAIRAILALAALAVVAALVLPAGAAPAAKKRATRTGPDSNQVLVRIGKEGITRADLQRRIESIPEQFRVNYTTPEGRQQLLDRMVEERIWLQLAVQEGVPNRPQVRQQLEQQRRDLVIRTYLNEVMATNAAPSDSEAHAYYDAHIADYKVPASITLRHIQLKKEADAKRVLQSAKAKNADWNALAKRFSSDTLSRNTGGSLGTVTRDGQFATLGAQPALAEAAMALGADQVGGPYKTEHGWHVIKVDAVKEESVRPFEQVRQVIVRQLGSQRSQDYYKSRLEEARKKLGVRPDSTAIRSYLHQKKSAREMFNEAQSAGAPEVRVEAYRRMLAEYPASDVSAQAQFMIGFIYSEELKDYDKAEEAFREVLRRYPKAELASSAQWMIEHMRTEDAPAFIHLDADSALAPQNRTATGGKEAPRTP